MLVSRPREGWSDPHYEALFALRYREIDDFMNSVKELPSAAVLDEHKENLLHKCARLGNSLATRMLLMWKHGQPDVNGQNIQGETPLHVALGTLDSKNVAVVREAAEIVLMLTDYGAQLFMCDACGNTPFGIVGKMPNCPAEVVLKMYYLVKLRCENMPRLMVDYGWRLQATFHMKNPGLTKHMLDLCPDLLKPGSNGKKPNELLHLALELGCQARILKMLLEFGDLDANAIFNGQTPLHVAAKKNFGSSYHQHINLLLERGANPKVHDSRCMSPIHYTVRHANPEVFELLIAAGSEVPRDDSQSWLPHNIHYAAANGHISIIRHLLTRSNINSRYLGKTPLHNAARERNVAAVYYLLAAGAEVDAVDNMGWSTLHHAVHGKDIWKLCNAVPVIGLLLHFGANVDLVNAERRTALYIACRRPNRPAVYQLVRHIALRRYQSPKETASLHLIKSRSDLCKLYEKCLQELTNLSEHGAANGVNYLSILQYTRKELALVATGAKKVSYVDLEEEGGVKFASKNFSPAAFPIYGNFLVSRIHHANLELMVHEEVGEIEDFNLVFDILALSAYEFIEFFKEYYLL